MFGNMIKNIHEAAEVHRYGYYANALTSDIVFGALEKVVETTD